MSTNPSKNPTSTHNPGTNPGKIESFQANPKLSVLPQLPPTSILGKMKRYPAPAPQPESSQAGGGGGGSTPSKPLAASVSTTSSFLSQVPQKAAGTGILAARKRTLASVPQSMESADSFRFLRTIQTLFGFGDREYACGIIPRGYGLTVLALSGCYSLLSWERNRIKKSKKKPPFTSTNIWFAKLKTVEKAYALARNDFPRTATLALLGGLGMPYAAAVGALFWCAGRAVDFHEAEEKPAGKPADNTEAVLCRFGKFLMICGICKFTFDFTRGRIISSPAIIG